MKTTRSSGVILHITSLPGPFGIGDLGPEAYRFADLLSECGLHYWQLLPLNPIDKRTSYSPYSSTSAFAGNSMLVSPELLVKEGLLSRKDLKTKAGFSDVRVEYDAVVDFKKSLLRTAYANFRAGSGESLKKEFKRFCQTQADWLEDYALFIVLDSVFKQVSWADWTVKIKEREKETLAELQETYGEEIDYVRFRQFLFYRQWQALRTYANGKGIWLFGDLPFYVSYDSADVWANPEIFKLDADERPKAVSGVPPDYFSKTGQLWGTPVYDWQRLKKRKYDWWIARLGHNLELFDVVRLDHFRAFYDFWEVPAGEKTAVKGKWIDGPGDDFFALLKQEFPEMPFIAEDLGEVSQGVYDLRDRWQLPGMSVLQYGFGEDISTSPFIIHNLSGNMVAYTGTHDNNTTKGWFRKELKPTDKARLNLYLDRKINSRNVTEQIMRLVLMSPAQLAIFPLQDFLNLDEKAIMNKPSTSKGNWMWRVTEEQLDSLDSKAIRELLTLFNRVPNEIGE